VAGTATQFIVAFGGVQISVYFIKCSTNWVCKAEVNKLIAEIKKKLLNDQFDKRPFRDKVFVSAVNIQRDMIIKVGQAKPTNFRTGTAAISYA
jgi:hypothetical protein